jgi:hypothetical protein
MVLKKACCFCDTDYAMGLTVRPNELTGRRRQRRGQEIQRPINPAHPEARRGAAACVEQLVGRPIRSLLSLRLGLFHAFGYRTRHSLDRTLRAFGQIIDRVCRHWHLLGRRVSGNCTHETEQAHDATDEKQRHPDETAPKKTGRAAAAKGREETGQADDEENQTHRCDERACDAQEGARPFVFWGL